MGAFLIFVIVAVIYFLPTIVVISNSHKQSDAIILLNLLTGWTGLGWLGALIWSVAK